MFWRNKLFVMAPVIIAKLFSVLSWILTTMSSFFLRQGPKRFTGLKFYAGPQNVSALWVLKSSPIRGYHPWIGTVILFIISDFTCLSYLGLCAYILGRRYAGSFNLKQFSQTDVWPYEIKGKKRTWIDCRYRWLHNNQLKNLPRGIFDNTTRLQEL